MPTYELSVILKALQRPELAQVIKRCCTNILGQGGIIRGMENLGLKPLPYRMKNHGSKFTEGNYILIKFDASTKIHEPLMDIFSRDTDVIRKNMFSEEEFVRPCLSGPCEFGEIKNPDHEKRLWWAKVKRRGMRWERDRQRKKA
ncbi:28S ribosomal protein S6 mitochondrial [Biomphalaria glabrata]|uniref:Small ribosomal subunit protein bS6m n=1 Tax=Biomphalaria glabrata TaxID=6526 RepID=A0A2C9KXQ9_BIOGL|nr:28S ribosomal protein S6, mitochondrial-like [Biomphalaria glabrata]